MKKKLIKHKYMLIEIFIFVIFFLFLLSVPSFMEEEEPKPELTPHSDVESASIVEENKFKAITISVIQKINNSIISQSKFQYVQNLLLENKISNRDNTVAQEIINLLYQNKTEIAKTITQLYVEETLDEFDLKEDQKWRNYLIYVEQNNTKHVIYNNTNLLLNYNDAKASASSELIVKPYQYQKYYLKLENGELKEIIIDLLSSNENVLSEYINFSKIDSGESEVRILDTQLFESNKKFKIKFLLWK